MAKPLGRRFALPAILVGLAVLGGLVLAGILARFGPAAMSGYRELAETQEAVGLALEKEEAAESLGFRIVGYGGHRILVVRWRPRRDLSPAELDGTNDHIWMKLSSGLPRGRFTSVVLVAQRHTDITVGGFHYSDTRAFARRVYGEPLDEAMVTNALSDD